jgi:hypothetical protein
MNSHTVFIPPLLLARAPGNIHRHQRMNSHTVFISRLSAVARQLGLLSLMQDGSRAGLENNGPPENAASESGSLPEEATRL